MNSSLACCRTEVDTQMIQNARSFLEKNRLSLIDYAKIFSLLGNEVRLKIIRLFLSYEKMCVCDLADVLEMNQSPISQHLRKLKDGGILQNKRDGMTIFYFINPTMKDRLKIIMEG